MTSKKCPKCGEKTKNSPVEYADGTVLYIHPPVHRDTPIPHWDMTNTCGPVPEEDDDEE